MVNSSRGIAILLEDCLKKLTTASSLPLPKKDKWDNRDKIPLS